MAYTIVFPCQLILVDQLGAEMLKGELLLTAVCAIKKSLHKLVEIIDVINLCEREVEYNTV